MIPLKLTIENFISHVYSELDFTQFNVALLVGAHSGNPDISNGVGKCLPGNTLIYDTDKNEVTDIKTFVNEKRKWTLGLIDGKVVPVEVSNWFELGKKKVLKIETTSGSSITTAFSHPFLSPSGCIRADSLCVGNWIAETRHIPINGSPCLSESESLLLGLLLGDGSTTESGIRFTNFDLDIINLFIKTVTDVIPGSIVKTYNKKDYVVVNNNAEIRKNRKELIKYLKQNNIPVEIYVGNNIHRLLRNECSISFDNLVKIEKDYGIDLYYYKCRLHAPKMFKVWLKKVGLFGRYAFNKFIPIKLWSLPEKHIASLITGLWLTGGYISTINRNGVEVSYCSASYKLVQAAKILLLRIGVISKINKKKTTNGFVWDLQIPVGQIFNFYEKVALIGKKKERLDLLLLKLQNRNRNPNFDLIPETFCESLPTGTDLDRTRLSNHAMSRDNYLKCGGSKNIGESDILWTRVKNILYETEEIECFDIEVKSKEHLYIAETFIVHNSAIFDAMRWSLYGKSRFSTKDKVVKRGKASCKVIFEFESGGAQYKIVRQLNKKSSITDVSFFKKIKDNWDSDGLSCDTSTMTNYKIIEVINMNDDTFVNSNYFRQNDISGFASASTAQRKEILKEVLQIGIWDDFYKIAKNAEKSFSSQKEVLEERIKFIGNIDAKKLENDNKVKKIKESMITLRNEVASLENLLREKKEVVSRFEITIASNNNFSNRKFKKEAARISSKAGELKDYRQKLLNEIKYNNELFVNADSDCKKLDRQTLDLLNDMLLVSNANRQENKERFIKLTQDLQQFYACLPCPRSKYSQKSLDEKIEKRNSHKSIIDQLHQKLKNLTLLEPGKECPTCLIEVQNPKGVLSRRNAKKNFIENRINEEQVLIDILNNSIKEEQGAINKANEARIEIERIGLIISKRMSVKTDATRRNETIQRELSEILEKMSVLKKDRDRAFTLISAHRDADKIELELDKAIIDRNDAILKVDSVRKQMVKFSVELGHLEGYGEELERRLSEKQTIVDQKNKLMNSMDIYSNVAKAFGKDGIQAIIMENVTEDLRKYTNSILKQICSEQMSIDFVTQKQTSSGAWKENFDIKISLGSAILDFDDLSGGEQVRMSIALRLALSQLLMRRVGSNVRFLLLDEVDQALDRQGIEALSETIISLSKSLKILVITHNESMKEQFDNIITIQKGSSGSILKQ
jgi:DNA repair exonuclease SbcCD ATPase subunit